MIYDEGNRRWVPSGSSQGLSKIHIYQHMVNNTFRVVGRKLHDHEVDLWMLFAGFSFKILFSGIS